MFESLNSHQTLTNCMSLWYVNMLDVTASYGMPFELIEFFAKLYHKTSKSPIIGYIRITFQTIA